MVNSEGFSDVCGSSLLSAVTSATAFCSLPDLPGSDHWKHLLAVLIFLVKDVNKPVLLTCPLEKSDHWTHLLAVVIFLVKDVNKPVLLT